MVQIPVPNCCGCTACANACPKAAIEMKEDFEGFLYPEVDQTKCINCGLCEKACPIENPPKISDKLHSCVVARSRDPKVLEESTSGGFIDALAEHYIERYQGHVCGVAYDKEFMPLHQIVQTREDTIKFRNSKYAQSFLGDTFSDVKQLLKQEKHVLFIGTPCQVAGLKSYLQKDYDTLMTVDIVCRSIPSPLLWREYLKWQQQRYNSEIIKVSCRKKTYGYHSGALEIEFANGRHYAGSNRVDHFMKSFHKNVCSRPSCYDCQFKTLNRCSDFTVFDSWKPDAIAQLPGGDDDRGYSNVLAHSIKAKLLLEQMNNVVVFDADVDKMMTFTGGMERTCVERNSGRDEFYRMLADDGFYKTTQKYAAVSSLDKLIEGVKPLKFKIEKIFK